RRAVLVLRPAQNNAPVPPPRTCGAPSAARPPRSSEGQSGLWVPTRNLEKSLLGRGRKGATNYHICVPSRDPNRRAYGPPACQSTRNVLVVWFRIVRKFAVCEREHGDATG